MTPSQLLCTSLLLFRLTKFLSQDLKPSSQPSKRNLPSSRISSKSEEPTPRMPHLSLSAKNSEVTHSKSETESRELRVSSPRSASSLREVQLLELDLTPTLDSLKLSLNRSPKKLDTNSKQPQTNSKHLLPTTLL